MVSEKSEMWISLPWIMCTADFIYMKSAQNAQTFFVYLCKMPFLEKIEKNVKKTLDFFLRLMYNRQALNARATSRVQNRSLKIEQHEISSTEKCRDLVNTLWKKKLIKVKR